jgi:hypothetical protein
MAQTLIDHDSIRRWADQHGARPARVRGTGSGSDPGILRLDFAGYSGEDSLDEIDWDEWFDKFDESRLALLVDESGRKPNFNKLVRRDGAESGPSSGRSAASAGRGRSSGGRGSSAGQGAAGGAVGDDTRHARPSGDGDEETFAEDEDEFEDEEFDEDDGENEEDMDRER